MARPRGPARARNSKQKQRCAYHKCRGKKDVKHSKWSLPVKKVDKSALRKIHSHAKTVRFCSEKHRDNCRDSGPQARRPYGPRECLTPGNYVLYTQIYAWPSIGRPARSQDARVLDRPKRRPWAAQVCLFGISGWYVKKRAWWLSITSDAPVPGASFPNKSEFSKLCTMVVRWCYVHS